MLVLLFFSYYLHSIQKNKEQRKLLEVLCLQGLRHASRARMREEKNVLFTPALLERERERERVYNYLELPNYLLSFSQY